MRIIFLCAVWAFSIVFVVRKWNWRKKMKFIDAVCVNCGGLFPDILGSDLFCSPQCEEQYEEKQNLIKHAQAIVNHEWRKDGIR
jgi:hypothetical protein